MKTLLSIILLCLGTNLLNGMDLISDSRLPAPNLSKKTDNTREKLLFDSDQNPPKINGPIEERLFYILNKAHNIGPGNDIRLDFGDNATILTDMQKDGLQNIFGLTVSVKLNDCVKVKFAVFFNRISTIYKNHYKNHYKQKAQKEKKRIISEITNIKNEILDDLKIDQEIKNFTNEIEIAMTPKINNAINYALLKGTVFGFTAGIGLAVAAIKCYPFIKNIFGK